MLRKTGGDSGEFLPQHAGNSDTSRTRRRRRPHCPICGRLLRQVRDAYTGARRGWHCVGWVVGTWEHQ